MDNAINPQTPLPASPSVLVVGTGAVGGFYGAKLAQAGVQVSVVCRSDYMVVKNAGIRIKSAESEYLFKPVQVLEHLEDFEGQPDFILVTLKVLPEINVADIIRSKVGPHTCVVLLQNGLGIEAPVAQGLPNTEIVSGLAVVCLNRVGSGMINHTAHSQLTLGRYPSGQSEKAETLCTLFNAAGIPCHTVEDIVRARWRKLVWNAPFNPISVLTGGVTTTQILALPDTREMVERIMREICQIAAAEGYVLEPDIIEKNIQNTEATPSHKTSMLQDYLAGRPMEIEAIVGAPLRIAKQHNLATPYLEMTYSLLKLAEQRLHEKRRLGAKLLEFFKTTDGKV